MINGSQRSRAFVASALAVVASVVGIAACMDSGSKSASAPDPQEQGAAPTLADAVTPNDSPDAQGQPEPDDETSATTAAADDVVEIAGDETAAATDDGNGTGTDDASVSSTPDGELAGNLESDAGAEAELESAAQSDAVPAVPVSDQRATPYVATGRKSGAQTKRVQKRLLELGFWLNGVSGRYGLTTRQALFAFQKWAGLERTGNVDEATAAALTNATHRAHASIADGTLVEIDETKQLFFLIREGRTMWVFNTATGTDEVYSYWSDVKPNTLEYSRATTPNGVFTVYRQKRKGWWWGDLGKIYRPKYFSGGVAIHGMDIVPPEPASHGCVRLSLPAMDFLWDNDLVPLGTTIWVHGEPKPTSAA